MVLDTNIEALSCNYCDETHMYIDVWIKGLEEGFTIAKIDLNTGFIEFTKHDIQLSIRVLMFIKKAIATLPWKNI